MNNKVSTGNIELVILDLDGVLVDTEWAETAALRELAAQMEAPMTAEDARRSFAGRKLAECISLIAGRSAWLPPENAIEKVRERCERLIAETRTPIAIDGAVEAVAKLGLPSCIASNSPPSIIDKRLRQVGLQETFHNRVYSAYDIESWKPDPDLFLWAASSSGARARDCVVVEDSDVGVAAGLAAGMRVLHLVDPAIEATVEHPNVLPFRSMRLLRNFLDRLTSTSSNEPVGPAAEISGVL